MNRRNLLRKLGIGTGAVAAGTVAGLAASVAKAQPPVTINDVPFKELMRYEMDKERMKYANLPKGGLPIVFVDGPWAERKESWKCVAHTGDTIHMPVVRPGPAPANPSKFSYGDKYLMTLASSRECYFAEYQK